MTGKKNDLPAAQQSPLLIVDGNGEISFYNTSAWNVLAEKYPDLPQDLRRLPAEMLEWFLRWLVDANQPNFSSDQKTQLLQASAAVAVFPGHYAVALSPQLGGIVDSQSVQQQSLTPRQMEVMYWLVQGKTNQQIADSMGIQRGTVKIFIEQILGILKVSNRTAAAHVARSWFQKGQ